MASTRVGCSSCCESYKIKGSDGSLSFNRTLSCIKFESNSSNNTGKQGTQTRGTAQAALNKAVFDLEMIIIDH